MQFYIEQTRTSLIVNSILLIIVGILFIINRDFAMELGLVIVGIFLIISGLMPMIMARAVDIIGILEVILGILLIIAPFVFKSIILFIIGGITILVGILSILGVSQAIKTHVFSLIVGILIVVAGILIMFDQEIIFTIYGIELILAGAMNLIQAYKS